MASNAERGSVALKTSRRRRKRRHTALHDGPRNTDVHVGHRVRLARTLSGLSQTELASAVGVTFQQLQKYEHGANRISASKLWQISRVLGVPVQWFFADADRKKQVKLSKVHLKRETLELVRSYAAAPADVRASFLQFVKTIAQQD